MKPPIYSISKQWHGGLAVAFLGLLLAGHAQAQIYLSTGGGTVGEYNLDGSAVNTSLVTGVSNLGGIAVSGGYLYVTDTGTNHDGTASNGKISQYNATTGAAVNASLYSGVDTPTGIAVSGSLLLVADYMSMDTDNPTSSRMPNVDAYSTNKSVGWIGWVNMDGGSSSPQLFRVASSGGSLYLLDINGGTDNLTVWSNSVASMQAGNPTAILTLSGVSTNAIALAASATDLYVANSDGTVSKYDATTGQLIASTLISGVLGLDGIAVLGSDLFLTNTNGTVSEYSTSGQVLDGTFITGVAGLDGIAVAEAVPEPSTRAIAAFGGLGLLVFIRRARRKAVLTQPQQRRSADWEATKAGSPRLA